MSLTVAAQDNDITTWAVEQRCIPDPIAVPDDWSYPGTILLSGYAGIHGVRIDWETPHVVAFFRADSNGNYPLIGGQLSPDGRWYAVPFGERFVEVSYNVYFFVEGWRVYSTSGDQQVLKFGLYEQEFYCYICGAGAWTYLPIEWVDNESLIIGGILSHPFENTVEPAPFDATSSSLSARYLSPDLEYAYGDISQDGVYRFGVYHIDNPSDTFTTLGNIESLSWRHDSSGFIALLQREAQDWLVYFNHDGELADYIFPVAQYRTSFARTVSRRSDILWSPDDKYFAFVVNLYPEPHRLYILDFEHRSVVDTCLNAISHPVWSPDGNMLAYVTPVRENLKVVVVDLERWQSFDVARHSGRTRVDMVGWRAEDI